jgi:hypothetical protein
MAWVLAPSITLTQQVLDESSKERPARSALTVPPARANRGRSVAMEVDTKFLWLSLGGSHRRFARVLGWWRLGHVRVCSESLWPAAFSG